MKLKESPSEFLEKLERRQNLGLKNKQFTLEQLAKVLSDYYKTLNQDARRAWVRKTVTMYANYENKFYGDVNQHGEWEDYPDTENDYTFSIPLLKAHVDTGITFYTKATPQYVAKPIRSDYRTTQLARMCQELGSNELRRMFDKKKLQREAVYLFLAGTSYRQLTNEVSDDSPIVKETKSVTEEALVPVTQCLDCGAVVEGEFEVCESCLSENVTVTEVPSQRTLNIKVDKKLPRPQVHIPNPVTIQTDYSSADKRIGFVIKRQRIRQMVAEYLYQTDLSGTDESADFSSDTLEVMSQNPVSRENVRADRTLITELNSYAHSMAKMVTEQELWLEPAEYGLYFTNEGAVAEQYPEGLYLHLVGNKVVDVEEAVVKREWVCLTNGVRPNSKDGVGMYHLAELNDLINNGINLEYAILKTVGFPTTLLRSRYLSENAEALDVLLVDNIPDEVGLDQVIHRVPAQNASGMLGVLSQRLEGYMQYVGGTWSPVGGASDLRNVMGTATGASAIQEMMSDRLGLAVQMRVQADIETLYAVLEYIQMDKSEGNIQLLKEQFGSAIVEEFFNTDIRSTIVFEAAKGTDEPQMDSVTAFKAQTFGGIVASMTGIREFDKPFFYDMVATLGEAFNLPPSLGTGRKERQVAQNQIALVQTMYKDLNKEIDMVTMDVASEVDIAGQIFTAVIEPDVLMAQQIPTLAFELYDFEAMKETFSDWLQSNEGQNSPIAVRMAVGMLFDYVIQASNNKQMMDAQRAMQMQSLLADPMAGMMAGADERADAEDGAVLEDEGEVPDNIKRDGSTGRGRPRDMPKPDEPLISETEGTTAPIAFDQGQPQEDLISGA